MRLDPRKGAVIRGYGALESTVRAAAAEYVGDAFGKNSFSGNEKNRLFLNDGSGQFTDLAGLSGAGHEGDGRAFGFLDYDRDGWTDIASVNANSPALMLFRNEIGSFGTPGRNSIALRLVGGNADAEATGEWSNRDGVGAVVRVTAGGRLLLRHRAAGEGFASQNSRTLVIGIGAAEAVDGIEIRWPSGKTSSLATLRAGEMATVYENPAMSGEAGAAYSVAPYRPAR